MPYTYNYPRLMLTVDAVVFREYMGVYEVLLIQRKHYPFAGEWALPGGFIDMDETAEEAVTRELKEETNLIIDNLKQLHTFSALGRDPRGRTVSITFYGKVNSENSKVKGGDDAKKAKWFPIDQIPRLAFDHIEAVKMVLNRINESV